MAEKSFQDHYDEAASYCYGCGRLNEAGLHLKSYWDGEEAVCSYEPRAYHTAIPGYVYGGLIASIIDCHSTGTASAAAYRNAGRELGTKPYFRYVTASLHIDYLQPTPIGETLMVRAIVSSVKGRKAVVKSMLYAGDLACAKGEVIVVEMPQHWLVNPESAD